MKGGKMKDYMKDYADGSMQALEIAQNRGATLCYVRRPTETEKIKYNPEDHARIFLRDFKYSGKIDLGVAIEFVKGRASNGTVPGYANSIYLITDLEWQKINSADEKARRTRTGKKYPPLSRRLEKS